MIGFVKSVLNSVALTMLLPAVTGAAWSGNVFSATRRLQMNLVNAVIVSLALGFIFEASWAGSMRCGTKLIESEQRDPVTRDSVVSECGPPVSESGSVLVYEENDTIYTLRFDSDGRLVVINDKPKQ